MKVTLIVLNYNNWQETLSFCDRIDSFKSIDSVVIVDNKSTDESFENLFNTIKNPKFSIIQTNNNGGYGSGNNYGIKYAIRNLQPDILLISNPDVIVEDHTILSLLKEFSADAKLAAIAPRMLDADGKVAKGVAWKLPTLVDDCLLSVMITSKVFQHLRFYSKKELKSEKLIVDVLPGSFFAIRTNAMIKVNYFDEETFLYCEERILAWKLKKEKLKVILLNSETYIHFHSTTIDKNYNSFLKKHNLLLESRILYLKKYLRIGKTGVFIFNFFNLIGLSEKYLINFFRKRFLEKNINDS